MFAVRGLAVCFSVFFILQGALGLAVFFGWKRVWVYGQQCSARRCADLLFALRLFPFVAAIGVTLVLAVPSFLLLEPHAVEEPIGVVPISFGLCGIVLMLAGVWNAVKALVRASRTVARWSSEARVIGYSPADSGKSLAVLRTPAPTPPLTVAGILRPTLWLSGPAEFVLTERELNSALRHEMAHVGRRDNLRKLLLRLVAAPGMRQLETAWRESTEMAADDDAVSNTSEALDLAAAVIKLSRLVSLELPAELTTALVHSPAESVNARVERLIAWTQRRQTPANGYALASGLCAIAAMVIAMAVNYSELLVQAHAATEWLVR
jgi:beta-lactamase regulating signal transducer with metallopeptidase domain